MPRVRHLTPPSSGRLWAGCASPKTPLMSNVSPMLRKISTTLFYIELVVLGIPVTMLGFYGLFYCCAVYASQRPASPDLGPTLFAIILATLGLLGFWSLAVRFISGGGPAVRSAGSVRLGLAALGALMALSPLAITTKDPMAAFAFVGAFGMPLLLPMLHMSTIAIASRR